MGYLQPDVRKTLKVRWSTTLALLFGAMMYFAAVSRWGALTLHIATSMLTRRS